MDIAAEHRQFVEWTIESLIVLDLFASFSLYRSYVCLGGNAQTHSVLRVGGCCCVHSEPAELTLTVFC